MTRATCETCRFHDALDKSCRKNPPTLVMVPSMDGSVRPGGAWPPARDTDWCGAHETEEEALGFVTAPPSWTGKQAEALAMYLRERHPRERLIVLPAGSTFTPKRPGAAVSATIEEKKENADA